MSLFTHNSAAVTSLSLVYDEQRPGVAPPPRPRLHALPDTRNDIMTPLISARRAAEDFARVVDGTRQDVADRYADLTATVDLLARARTHPRPAPSSSPTSAPS